jgi:uncharacterized protein (TIGR00251 family)
MTWLRASGNGVLLTLHIQPGAKKTEVVGLHGDALKLRLAAPPVDGKANEALIAFLANRLDVSKSQLSLVSGQTSRSKRVAISDMIATEVERKLCPAGKAG